MLGTVSPVAGPVVAPSEATDGAVTPGTSSLFRGTHPAESIVVFLIGFALMHFFYSGTGGVTGDELGLPGNDSFYHVKMSELMVQGIVPDEFPWLKFAYFTKEGQRFVSHHFGFHLLMTPFVKLSQYLYGDSMAGGRWATSVFFGLMLVVFNLLLISEDVRWRWLWLMLFLVMPIQFFTRHAFVRAITPSLLIMLLTLLFLFRRRYVLAALAVWASTQLYLGGVMFAPVIVALYAVAMALGSKETREFPWSMVLLTAAGWLLGLFTYPYSEGMAEFLRLQVFGTGLTPDIPVGQEWQPYQDLWWFGQMIGPTAAVWAVCLAVRLRLGPALNAREFSLILMNFAFLVLMVKARRFVEYWPMFCLLSSAYLVAPHLRRASDWLHAFSERQAGVLLAIVPIVFLTCCAAATLFLHKHSEQLPWMEKWLILMGRLVDAWGPMIVEWKVWVSLATLYLLVVLVGPFGFHPLSEDRSGIRWSAWGVVPILLLTLVLSVWGMVYLVHNFAGKDWTPAKISFHWTMWVVFSALCLAGLSLFSSRGQTATVGRTRRGGSRAVLATFTAMASLVSTTAVAGRQMVDIQNSSRCQYDLATIRRMMAFLKERSQPGDVIFTDDWDVFPVYFYHNTHNYYIVGLDPKFTHERRPDLWQRYVKVSRGEVPSDSFYTVRDEKGERRERVHCRLEDIRDHFESKYVITDRDHKSLASKLAAAKHLAELIFPVANYEEARDAPYLVFRIREEGEVPGEATIPPPDPQGLLYLSLLTPLSVQQGWGDFTVDRSVGGGPIQPDAQVHLRGLGTHAPSRLVYAIPEGYDFFEATVGINRSTKGAGSVRVSVSLDDREPIYVSPLLTGTSEPAPVRVPLNGAKRILLQADPTADGNRFDHVDWAGARFVRSLP